MHDTRKFPVGLVGNQEFAIPFSTGSHGDVFCGIETGEEYSSVAVTYIGRSIGPQDVLDKCRVAEALPDEPREALAFIDDFLAQLAEYKIGNVLVVQYAADNEYSLLKVADRPPSRPGPKLPG